MKTIQRVCQVYRQFIWAAVKLMTVMFLFCVISALICRVGLRDGVLFFLFQVFFILLPGSVLAILLSFPLRTQVEWIGFSYFLGYSFDFVLYLLIVPFHVERIVSPLFLGIILTVICFAVLLFILRHRPDNPVCERDRKGEWICLFFLVSVSGFCLWVYSGNNMIPGPVKIEDYNRDLFYWIGNTVELTKEFPPLNFRDYPKPYNYHYFSSMQLAFVSVITGIRPVVAGFVFHYLQSAVLLVFGSYILYSTMVKKNSAAVFAAVCLTLFSSGIEEMTFIIYSWRMYFVPFGYDYGMAFFLWILWLLYLFHREKEFNMKLAGMLVVLIVIQTGLKGPCGVAAITMGGFLCIGKLMRKKVKESVLTGLPMLIAFILTYILVVNVSGYNQSKSTEEYFYQISNETFDNNALQNTSIGTKYTSIKNSGIPLPLKIPLLLCCAGIFTVLINPVSALLGYSVVVQWLRKKKTIDAYGLSLVFLTVVLCVITLHWHIFGSSEMYFAMTAVPLGVVLYMHAFGQEKGGDASVICAGIIAGLVFFVFGSASGAVEHYMRTGYSALVKHVSKPNYGWESGYDYVTIPKYEGYEYVRGLPGEMILTNLAGVGTGCFTEKYVIRDPELKQIFAAQEGEERNRILSEAKEAGIDYIMVDREQTPDYILDPDRTDVIFENEELLIYEVRESAGEGK